MLSKDKIENDQEAQENINGEGTPETANNLSDSTAETLNEEASTPAQDHTSEPEEPSMETPAEETGTAKEAAEAEASDVADEVEAPDAPVAEAEVPEATTDEPETPDTPVAEAEQETAPEEASTPDTPVAEAPEADAEEPEATDAPTAEAETLEAAADQADAGTEELAPAAAPEGAAEEAAPEASNEETPESEEAPEEPLTVSDSFSEEEMMKQIDQILDNAENLDALIENANPSEMILMIDHFYHAEEVRPYIRRVGLIKRAFDAIRDKQEVPTALLTRFSTSLARFNKKRSEYQAALEVEKEENSRLKRELITQLKEVVDAEDMTRYNEVRDMQDRWKKIGFVRKEDMDLLNQEYRYLLDQYYKQREIHLQLRDYDRKINLQDKEKLLIELTHIIPAEEDREKREIWQQKNDMLTDIQLRWRAVGHVPREDLDRINQTYRKITEEFFNLRHEFYESQDEEKKENTEKKEALLVRMQEFAEFGSDKPKAWNEATNNLRKLQEEWKEIGRASKEKNSDLWKQYRAVGNAFFAAKAAFFRQLDDMRQENLQKKRELCEKAEALVKEENIEKTANELKALQVEWKKIGSVPDRYSNKLWQRFRAACDAFFETRRSHYDALRSDENANLDRKKALIQEVRKISVEEAGSADEAIAQIKEIQARWKGIGRVPYKDKDTIWKEFRAEIDQFFDDLRANRDRSNYAKLKSSVKSLPVDKKTRAIKDKIFRATKKIQASEEMIEQYSTNIQFISKGKSGDALREQIQGQIDKEKRALENSRKHLRQLEDLLKNPPKEEKPKEEEAKKEEAPAEAKKADAPTEKEADAPAEQETEAQPEAKASDEAPEAKEETPPSEEADTVPPSKEEKPAEE